MKTNSHLQDEAIRLRLLGKTYSEINNILPKKIPKSTLSVWLKNLTFTTSQRQRLERNISDKIISSQKKAVKATKQAKINRLNTLRIKNVHLLPLINKDIQKIMLSILYMGEGSKSKSSQNMTLGNVSPKIIKLYFTLLENCFKIDKSKFRIRIQCRADQNVKQLEHYWQKITKIPEKQFYPTYIDRRTIGKPTLKKNYKGICAVTYFDRSIQYELELLYESMLKYLLKGR